MRFWENVRAVLKSRKKSLRSFAREVGVSPSALTNYSRGGVPNLTVASRIAEVLGMSLDALVWGSPGQGEPPPCRAPLDHEILQELVDELGLQEVFLISKLGTLDVALRISDHLKSVHPRGATRDEIAQVVSPPNSEVFEASLVALRRKGVIKEFERSSQVCYKLRAPVSASFTARESGDLVVHIKRAVRILFSDVLPALERGGEQGHLITVNGRIPESVARRMVRTLNAEVEKACREAIAQDGRTEFSLVFGVAMQADMG